MSILPVGMSTLGACCLMAACLWGQGVGNALAQQQQAAGATDIIAPAHTNRLIDETSPYLLQHAHNPVDWYPWGAEAFAKAQTENKPVFLSVGYSTCYWCHVMERESFEHAEVAQILNEHFVCIKVDREEHPELDQQFMLATQLIVGRGGWPNSLWLTSDGRPWMAGTYFPREQFKSALRQLADAWQNRQPEIQLQADSLTSSIARIGMAKFQSKAVSQDLLDQAVASALEQYDAEHGGFSKAPKFPPHAQLKLLVDQFRRFGDQRLRDMIDATLTHMSRGGIFDQLGGGFHRYSTDERWLLPHFEKMLYDNAQLVKAYTDGFLLTGKVEHKQTVERIFQWLQRDMVSPAGAFYSAIDSESSGQEGKFYVWKYDELIDQLGQADGARFAVIYNVQPAGNFKEEATGHVSGNNVLHLRAAIAELADQFGLTTAELEDQLAAEHAQLLNARNQRVAPIRDDKIIAGWNGLMIEALAYAGRQLGNESYVLAARRAADFILETMIVDGQLHRTATAGEVKFIATLEDHAFVAAAFIELYRASGEQRYLTAASQLADRVLSQFDDPAGGGFFFTAETSKQPAAGLVIRAKNMNDGGNLPSGNGVMTQVLFDLFELTEEPRFAAAAERNLTGLSGYLWRSAGVADEMLIAAAKWLARQTTQPPTPATEIADASFTATAIQGEVYLSQLKLAPGDTLRLAIRCTIDPQWHLYGPNPGVDFVQPTTVAVAQSPLFKVIAVKLPAEKLIHDPVLDRQLRTYAGSATFLITLEIAKDAPLGPAELQFTVNSQACDARQCAQPEQTQIQLKVTVVPPGQSADSQRHHQVFAK